MMVPGMACDNPLSFQLQALLCASQAPTAFGFIPLCHLRLTALAPARLLPRSPERDSWCRLRTALRTRPEARTWMSQPQVPRQLIPRCFPRSIPRGGGRGALHPPERREMAVSPRRRAAAARTAEAARTATTAGDRLPLPRNTLSSAFAQPLLGKMALKEKLDVWWLGSGSGTSLWHPE